MPAFKALGNRLAAKISKFEPEKPRNRVNSRIRISRFIVQNTKQSSRVSFIAVSLIKNFGERRGNSLLKNAIMPAFYGDETTWYRTVHYFTVLHRALYGSGRKGFVQISQPACSAFSRREIAPTSTSLENSRNTPESRNSYFVRTVTQ